MAKLSNVHSPREKSTPTYSTPENFWWMYSSPENSSPATVNSSFLVQEEPCTPEASAPSPREDNLPTHINYVLSTLVLLSDNKPLCSICEHPGFMEVGDCGHVLCPDCLHDEPILDRNNNNPKCNLCRVTNQATKHNINIQARYLSNHAPDDVPASPAKDESPPCLELWHFDISDTGDFTLKPEFEYLDLEYKIAHIPGSYLGARVMDEDEAILQLYRNLRRVVRVVRVWLEGIVKRYERTREMAEITVKAGYNAIATSAKKQYKRIQVVPERLRARIDMENRGMRAELETMKLKLAETKLDLREGAGRVADCSGGVLTVKVLWALLFIGSLVLIAWFADVLVLDLGFDSYEEWLGSSI